MRRSAKARLGLRKADVTERDGEGIRSIARLRKLFQI